MIRNWNATRLAITVATLLGTLAGFGLLLSYWSRQDSTDTTPPAASPDSPALVEFSNFSARHERSPEGDRLSVSLRLRSTRDMQLPCFVFVLAHAEGTERPLWAIWPEQPSGSAVTASGHFHGANPSRGFGMLLTTDWERVTSTHPEGTVPFNNATVYVVAPSGQILLTRPFKV